MPGTNEPSGAQKLIGDFAPKLASLIRLRSRGLSSGRRQTSPNKTSSVTVASLIAGGSTEQLRFHLGFAKDNGLTETELLRRLAQGHVSHHRRPAGLRRRTELNDDLTQDTTTTAEPPAHGGAAR
jgi:4-carboxymuconolactone decarboxylase